uniref:Uncharacterized protein n=1 Tax=Arundo donax TaxID=35708 RepID=A0A0A9A809_ARUDO
MRKKAKAVPE